MSLYLRTRAYKTPARRVQSPLWWVLIQQKLRLLRRGECRVLQAQLRLADLNRSIERNKSINQSINPSIERSINQSIHPLSDQSINQSSHWVINQSINPSIERSINQSIEPLSDQSINQSIDLGQDELDESSIPRKYGRVGPRWLRFAWPMERSWWIR